jgi:hypothetical protein
MVITPNTLKHQTHDRRPTANLLILLYAVAIIYGVIWSIGLLRLILNSARLAKAAALWLKSHTPAQNLQPGIRD